VTAGLGWEDIMARKILLTCGVVSSLLYVVTDIAGALQWDGYSYVDQTISELAAIGAPSRPLVAILFMIYGLLLIPFAAGFAVSAGSDRNLRIAAIAFAGVPLVGFVSSFFPIHVRGTAWTINETMHSVLTAITVVMFVTSMVYAAHAAGRKFLAYSIVTIAVTLLFGALAGWTGRRLVDDLPTPWIGVTERISVFAYLAWVAAVAVVLMRREDEPLPGAGDGMLHA
jgi:hypothetical protein